MKLLRHIKHLNDCELLIYYRFITRYIARYIPLYVCFNIVFQYFLLASMKYYQYEFVGKGFGGDVRPTHTP